MADPDRIAEVFKDSTIFLTGVTGLVGKALIEKLLRFTEAKKIFVLIREKKGKTPNERIRELFTNPIFGKLLEKYPNAPKKCVPITGDVSLLNLGISEDNRKLLIEEVNFICHSAATVRFDDTLKFAVTVNTRGTKFMLDLAEECKNLKLFIHISTAYAFPNNPDGITFEKEYDPPANPHDVISSVNWLSEDVVTADISRRLLRDIPNTYTFSKALSESLVYEKVGKIPVIICRPAVVTPTYKDPFPGWTNNLQGPGGLFVGAGKGIIRSVYMDITTYANYVPIDCTVSAIMMFTWYHLTSKDPQYIFNLCMPHKDLLITWEYIFELARDVVHNEVPFNTILWYPEGTITRSRLWNKICTLLFQLFPALIIDMVLLVAGKKPQFLTFQKRIAAGMEMYEFYTTRRWNFETKYVETVREMLNSTELENYQLQEKDKNVRQYMIDGILYLRRTFFKETDDTLPWARTNMKIMYWVDKIVKGLLIAFILRYLYNAIFVTS